MHELQSARWPSTRLAALGIALALTGLSGCKPKTAPAGEVAANSAGNPVQIDVVRYQVSTRKGDYALGGDAPLVTIVLFSNYACEPCARTWAVMKNLVEDYKGDLRVVYRSVKIPGYRANDLAVDAVYAAGEQGKFWEMHERLFAHSGDFSRPVLEAHATELGLDVKKFASDLDLGVVTSRRLTDAHAQEELGVFAGPAAFANGILVMGFRAEDLWHALVDEEIARSRQLLKDGVVRGDIYREMQKTARRGPIDLDDKTRKLLPDKKEKDATPEVVAAPDPETRYLVRPKGDFGVGPVDAPVVIVEFTDFQCPYCKKGNREVFAELRKKYAADVRWESRQLPLPMHMLAKGAAKAALAAEKQQKFWEYHQALFETHDPLTRENLVALAGKLGMDVEKFERDYVDASLQAELEAEMLAAAQLGVNGTPALFINGKYLEGLHSLETYTVPIDAELARAKELAVTTPREQLHAALMQGAIGPQGYPNPDAKPTPSTDGG